MKLVKIKIEISKRKLIGAEGITEDIIEKLVLIWEVTGRGVGRHETAKVDHSAPKLSSRRRRASQNGVGRTRSCRAGEAWAIHNGPHVPHGDLQRCVSEHEWAHLSTAKSSESSSESGPCSETYQ